MQRNSHNFFFEHIFNQLCTCMVKIETISGFALMGRVKILCLNVQKYWSSLLGGRGQEVIYKYVKTNFFGVE